LLLAMYFHWVTEVAGAMSDGFNKWMNVNEAHESSDMPKRPLHIRRQKSKGKKSWEAWWNHVWHVPLEKQNRKCAETSEHQPATKDTRQMFLDIATIKQPKKGPNVTKPNWLIIVDKQTQLNNSSFYEKKNGMVEPSTCEKLHKWKQAGLPVK
jgi:hypothetical protein